MERKLHDLFQSTGKGSLGPARGPEVSNTGVMRCVPISLREAEMERKSWGGHRKEERGWWQPEEELTLWKSFPTALTTCQSILQDRQNPDSNGPIY